MAVTAVHDRIAVSLKWVNELDPGVFEIASIASDDGQIVVERSRSHETVLFRHASAGLTQVGQQSCPAQAHVDAPCQASHSLDVTIEPGFELPSRLAL